MSKEFKVGDRVVCVPFRKPDGSYAPEDTGTIDVRHIGGDAWGVKWDNGEFLFADIDDLEYESPVAVPARISVAELKSILANMDDAATLSASDVAKFFK